MRLVDMGVEPFLVSSTVEGVMAQRLVRTLCKECREPVRAPPRGPARRFPLGRLRRHRPGTCTGPAAAGAAAAPATAAARGIYELLVTNDEIRRLVSERTRDRTSSSRRPSATACGPCAQDGWRKVARGRHHDRRSAARHQGRLTNPPTRAAAMPEFAYTARTLSGENVAGTITAGRKRETLAMLAEKSLFPMQVESAERRPVPAGVHAGGSGASVLATNLTQLADLLQNGVPLLASLEILAEQATHPPGRSAARRARPGGRRATRWTRPSPAIPDVFNELTVSMVRAGSEGAFLEDALKRTADFLELQEQLKDEIVGAMTYPAFLAVAGHDRGGDPDRVLRAQVRRAVRTARTRGGRTAHGHRHPAGTERVPGTLRRASSPRESAAWARGCGTWPKTPEGRMFVDRWKLRVPIFGKIFLNSAVSRFCRVLGTLLQNGVPILRPWRSAPNRPATRCWPKPSPARPRTSRPATRCPSPWPTAG